MKHKSIVVVGTSGSGKTTTVNGLRSANLIDVVIPKRFITRPKRHNDDLAENTHIDIDEFHSGRKSGAVWPSWSRDLGGEKEEWYGFEPISQGTKLTVFSANNAFIRSSDEIVKDVLATAQIVVVHAPLETRYERLALRSPDMLEHERQKRLSDDSSDILEREDVIIIDTSVHSEVEAQALLIKIAQDILSSLG